MKQLILLGAVILATGCDLEGRKAVAEACDLNSDCDAPLVCRLSRCRVECTTSRDCALGLDCIFDSNNLGACQVPDETTCMLNSDCTAPLVCRMGRCVNECADDRDCAPGQLCCPGTDERCAAIPADANACFEPDRETCAYNTDCADGRVCTADGRCRLQCRELGTSRDCRAGEVCVQRGTMETGFSQVCLDERLLEDAGTGS